MRHGRASAWKTGRPQQALDSVDEQLATPHGIVLQQPAYSQYYLQPGRNFLLPAGLQGKCRHLLPHQPVDHDRRNHAWGTAIRPIDYYLRINPPRAKRSAKCTAASLMSMPR